MRFAVVLILSAGALCAQTADEIMTKVGQSQDADVAARAEFVYHQNLLVRMNRANGKLAREETREYTVAPSANGVKRDLVTLHGKIQEGRKVIEYTEHGYKYKGIDIDGDLVNSFADDFGADEKSKDGLDHDLFPLRSNQQHRFVFKLIGPEKWRDRNAFHIGFTAAENADDDHHCWAGEAFIDAAEYQPLMVETHFTCKIPMLVKTMLGTNVKQIGFKVTYQKVADGVWFPASYGGELEFRAVFMYARRVGIGLQNSDFRRTKVDTAINYEPVQ